MKRAKRSALGLVGFGVVGLVVWHLLRTSPSVANLERGQLEHGGRRRTFLFAKPDGAGPFPLVIALHGRMSTATEMAALTRFDERARAHQFIAVFPEGVERSWADGRGATPASHANVDDVAFLSSLIDELVKRQLADASRVYVVGMSNGGFMALGAACFLSKKVAAVGSVTGFLATTWAKSCAPERTVPVYLIASDADRVVPFAGGTLSGDRGETLGALETTRFFAERASCAQPAQEHVLTDRALEDGTRVTRFTFSPCVHGAVIQLDVVAQGGHTWPGGRTTAPESAVGRTSRDVDASEELWRFFSQFSRDAD